MTVELYIYVKKNIVLYIWIIVNEIIFNHCKAVSHLCNIEVVIKEKMADGSSYILLFTILYIE